jgi:hypothetical protein
MKKMISIILGIVLIGLVILIIIPSSFHVENGPETLVKEADIGGDGTQIQFVTVSSDDDLKVSITNVTKISDTTNVAEIKVFALKIEGANGQLPESYGNNVIKKSKFGNLKTSCFDGNITYDKGVKSFGFVTNNVKAHVTILKRF